MLINEEDIIINEEDIRVKLIMPFLNDLGFDLSEISVEDSFTIRLGTTEKPIRGKSDILCKRQGKNLFIIELKKDSRSITTNDARQGISYARALVGNIAPFTIVTNGKETKIFDTISELDLTGTKISEQSTFWKNGCKLSLDEDIGLRYEALKNFVSFSDSNMKIFCDTQVKYRMTTITGDFSSSSAKFVEKLHVQREALHLVFKNFVDSEFSVFGLVGNAGVGKTCSMCSLTLEALNQSFVLFYNAALIGEPLLQAISRDLNLFFSSKSQSDLVLSKLSELASFTKKKVIIFIDGIDENTVSNFSLELSEISLAIGKLDSIKLCISCKLTIWNSFLKKNDTPNYVYEELNKFHSISPNLNDLPGYLLEDFNNDEISSILPLYQKTFNFKGLISDSLKKQLTNGFFLRIFSEVYSNKQIPSEITDVQLIKKYLDQ